MPIISTQPEKKRSNARRGESTGEMRMTVWRSCKPLVHGAHAAFAGTLLIAAIATHAQAATTTDGKVFAAQGPAIATCVACHGDAGAGTAIGAPRLAGKNPDYLAHALSMFKAGTRASDDMQAVARDLSEADMRDFAMFFTSQHPPRVEGGPVAPASLVSAGRQLAESGAGPDVPACFSCHGADGKGNGARFPSIMGESAAFIVKRLHAFQERAKGTSPAPGTMTSVAARLSSQQIDEAAAYLGTTDP